MPDQYAIQDQNRFPAQLVHSGTAGTATTIRQTGQVSGAADIHVTGGTVVTDPTSQNGTSLHVRGTTAVSVWGTIVAPAGTGTKQYISNVDIVVASGTVDVAVTNVGVTGSSGAGVLARGQFVPSGGMAKSFNPVSKSGANGTVAYWLGGAGTVDINVTYWQAT